METVGKWWDWGMAGLEVIGFEILGQGMVR